MEHRPVSVLIPARNEENTIEQTVLSAINNGYPGELEVLVGANGCTDDTEAIVERLSQEYPNVGLVVTEPGKPNAWNALFTEAQHDDLIFMDGDVLAKRGSFEDVQAVYEKSKGILGVAAGLIKVFEDMSLFEKLFNLPSESPASLNGGFSGGMYGIRRDDFIRRMASKGYETMPTELINEDAWVYLVLEDRSNGRVTVRYWDIAPNARFYVKPASFEDEFKRRKRIIKGRLQLAYEHPTLEYDASQADIAVGRLKMWYDKWSRLEDPVEKAAVPFFFLARKVTNRIVGYFAHRQARAEYFAGNVTTQWEIPHSTKTTFKTPID